MSNYKDGVGGADLCFMEGCLGDGPYCPRCGETNYQMLSVLGYIGRMAKKWGVSKDVARDRIWAEAARKEEAREVGRVYA
jgi:hypothetical protein